MHFMFLEARPRSKDQRSPSSNFTISTFQKISNDEGT